MAEIVIMGELLVEIMRAEEDVQLYETGKYFRGPFPSGAPGIFISTAARLGHSAAIISGVGDEASTGVAFVTYFKNGDRKFIFHINHTPAVAAKAPEKTDDFNDTKYFHVMGCSLMASVDFGKEVVKTMHMLKEKGVKVSFDPNVRLEMLKDPEAMEVVKQVYRESNIFMPGVSELKMITGEDDLEKAIKKVFDDNKNMELLVLKNGSKGSEIYGPDGLLEKVGVYPVTQVDATGAGDSYDAAFICGLAEGKNVKEAAQMGAAAGALNAAAFGPMEGNISRVTVKEMIKLHEK